MRRQQGSREQFAALVTELSAQLYRAVFLICRDAGTAEDLVQETWLRVARHWPRVCRMASPHGYAYRIAMNLALSERRRSTRLITTEDRNDTEPDINSHRALQSVDDRAELRDALHSLTERQRAVLVLRYWEDRPESEVAEILGCSAGTVKSTASRALATVRATLAEALTTNKEKP